MARKDSPSGKTGSQKVKRAEKQREALRLRRDGCTYDEIAAELGIGRSTAHEYVRSALADLAEQSIDEAKILRAIEDERLTDLYKEARERVDRDERGTKAIDTCVRIVQARVSLHGLSLERSPDNEMAALDVLVRAGLIDVKILQAIADQTTKYKEEIAVLLRRETN
jgi:predicted DNA-binding protein (UPF0251 family)